MSRGRICRCKIIPATLAMPRQVTSVTTPEDNGGDGGDGERHPRTKLDSVAVPNLAHMPTVSDRNPPLSTASTDYILEGESSIFFRDCAYQYYELHLAAGRVDKIHFVRQLVL